jgi:hypothetical protein
MNSPDTKQFAQLLAFSTLHERLFDGLIVSNGLKRKSASYVEMRRTPSIPSEENIVATSANSLDDIAPNTLVTTTSTTSDQEDVDEVDVKDILTADTSAFTDYLTNLQQAAKETICSYLQSIVGGQLIKGMQLQNPLQKSSSSSTSTTLNTTSTTATKFFASLTKSLYGYSLQNLGQFEAAIREYSYSNLISDTRITYCILQLFLSEFSQSNFSKDFSEIHFIDRFYLLGNKVLALQGYRLMLELVYFEIKRQLPNQYTLWDKPIYSIGNFRSYPRTESALRNQELMSP